MKLLNRLERSLGKFALPELTLYLVCGQAAFLIMALARPEFLNRVSFQPHFVLEDGEWWRVLTFPFYPPTLNPIFAIFGLYLTYIMGTALEHNWGTFRYNLYLLIAYVASVAGAFVSPHGVATSAYFSGSIFLAFAQLYPNFTILLFFILPIQIKWLALVTWCLYGWSLLVGDTMTRMLVLASVLNFLLFFWRDIIDMFRTGRRRMKSQLRLREEKSSASVPFHTCAACGITDKSHPKMEFRYCPECGGLGYCIDHIHNHAHRRSPAPKEGAGGAPHVRRATRDDSPLRMGGFNRRRAGAASNTRTAARTRSSACRGCASGPSSRSSSRRGPGRCRSSRAGRPSGTRCTTSGSGRR
jgi:hypothetical protein